MASKRKEMELALARQFGYDDYESFREGVSQSMGKAVLRRLEKELDKYGPAEGGDAAEPRPAGTPPPARPAPPGSPAPPVT